LDSEESAAMILNRKPDIAILNSSLRDGSGIDVLRHIKQLMIPPTIIAVTDDPSDNNKNTYSAAGADFIIDKTTEDHKIINAVRLLCMPKGQIESLDSSFATFDKYSTFHLGRRHIPYEISTVIRIDRLPPRRLG